jgi:hypothetical protein
MKESNGSLRELLLLLFRISSWRHAQLENRLPYAHRIKLQAKAMAIGQGHSNMRKNNFFVNTCIFFPAGNTIKKV